MSTITIPKGAYCTDEAQWTRTDEVGRVIQCFCCTYNFPSGKLAGFLTMESCGDEVLYEEFDRA